MRKFHGWIWLVILLAVNSLRAQEAKISSLVLVPLADYPADTPPVIISAPLPAYPPAWLKDRQPRWATVGLLVKNDGTVQVVDIDVEDSGTIPQDLTQLAYHWRFKPGQLNGRSVTSTCRAILLFNPPKTGNGESDSAVRIVSAVCTPPLSAMNELLESLPYEASLLIKPNGTCTVLDLAPHPYPGKRSLAEQAAYAAPEITAAVKATFDRWRFEPAHQDGQAVAQKITLLTWAVNDRRLDFIEPKPLSQIHPEYPYSLRKSGNKGTVVVGFIVNVNGQPEKPQVVSSSHPDFERPAIAALLQWKFKPGTIGGIPRPMQMRVPIIFEINNSFGEPLGQLHLRGSDPYEIKGKSRAKPGDQFSFDEPPIPQLMIQPVYPFEALKAGKTGSASATWIIGPDGIVAKVFISKASTPEFGQAAAAAIYEWKFKPAKLAGKPTTTALKEEIRFDTDARDFEIDNAGSDLLNRIKKNSPVFPGLKDLDHVPKGLYQTAPHFPPGSKTGQVMVEFYIDEDGQARFPHAISNTNADLVYPALTAVARWRFEPPLQKGKQTAAIAQIPIVFNDASPAAPAP